MRKFTCFAVVLLVLAAVTAAQNQPSLKDVFKGDFHVGVAVNQWQVAGRDPAEDALIKAQFNTITPENVLKWERVHPKLDIYNFGPADEYVDFGEKNHMYIVGHTLVWHAQTPKWVFEDDKGQPLTRDALLQRMHDHIKTVVGRYKGRIKSWDVVNEALNDDGTLRQSPWLKIIGEDFIAKAFEYAHEADPEAQLNYNDYSLVIEAKRKAALKLIAKLKAEGVPVGGVGMQGHYHMDWPTSGDVDTTIAEFKKLGVKVMITELDIDVLPDAMQNMGADVTAKVELQDKLNPYAKGLPPAVSDALAKRYADLFSVFLKHRDVLTRVTFWGVTDRDSWLNNWPVRGRTSYPLLFDRQGQPKAAFQAVVATTQQRQKAPR